MPGKYLIIFLLFCLLLTADKNICYADKGERGFRSEKVERSETSAAKREVEFKKKFLKKQAYFEDVATCLSNQGDDAIKSWSISHSGESIEYTGKLNAADYGRIKNGLDAIYRNQKDDAFYSEYVDVDVYYTQKATQDGVRVQFSVNDIMDGSFKYAVPSVVYSPNGIKYSQESDYRIKKLDSEVSPKWFLCSPTKSRSSPWSEENIRLRDERMDKEYKYKAEKGIDDKGRKSFAALSYAKIKDILLVHQKEFEEYAKMVVEKQGENEFLYCNIDRYDYDDWEKEAVNYNIVSFLATKKDQTTNRITCYLESEKMMQLLKDNGFTLPQGIMISNTSSLGAEAVSFSRKAGVSYITFTTSHWGAYDGRDGHIVIVYDSSDNFLATELWQGAQALKIIPHWYYIKAKQLVFRAIM